MATKEELKEMFSDGKKPTGADFAELIDGVKGKDGRDGTDGVNGQDGEDGQDGADGFGTEEQYNDIISRLEALENADEGTDEE